MKTRASLRATLEGPPRRIGFVVPGVACAVTAVVAVFLFRPPAGAPRVAPQLTSMSLPRAMPVPRDPIPDPEPLDEPDTTGVALERRPVPPDPPAPVLILAKRAAPGVPPFADPMPAEGTNAEPEPPPLPDFPIPPPEPSAVSDNPY
jgi:hypothetical protein